MRIFEKKIPIKWIHCNAITPCCMSIQLAGLQKLKILNNLNVSCMNNKPFGNININ
jgi:hypothetical protein